MLPSKKRISREVFPKRLFSGKTIHGPHFVVHHFPLKKEIPRYAVIVSKKAIKTSVKRHHLKRRVYEIIEKFEKTNHIFGGYYIIVCKKTENNTDFSTLAIELKDIFLKFQKEQ